MKPSQPLTTDKKLVLYFQVHQPRRLKKVSFLDIGKNEEYFDEKLDRQIVSRIARNCYLPMNSALLKLIDKFPDIRVCFSLSGVAIDQFERFTPEVLHSFKALAETGAVEFLSETSHHSLASIVPSDEFITEVNLHRQLLQQYFGVVPTVFRNTELIYSSSIGSRVAHMGFKGMICDGVDRVLQGKSTYKTYTHPSQDLKLLLRANRLSDDIAFRFQEADKKLTVDKYAKWLYGIPEENGVITLGIDYETFGEHQRHTTGIIDFMQQLITKIAVDKTISMATPTEVFEQTTGEKLDIHEFVSWADEDKDISAWVGNEMQRDAFNTLQGLESYVRQTGDTKLIEIWRHLQTSDHFYYMSTKSLGDGSVHSYFSHYASPYEAFINYMNILSDFSLRAKSAQHVDNALTFDAGRKQEELPAWSVDEYVSGHSHAIADH